LNSLRDIAPELLDGAIAKAKGRDTLKFQRERKLGVGPTPFLVKPWRRVGS
jgi:hypothetical protein